MASNFPISMVLSGGVANLFPGHQKTSAAPEAIVEKPKTPEVINSPVPEVSESEWETDVTEDEQEQAVVKQDTPHLEDALAKLDQLDLESDDEMRYQRQSKTAGKREEKPHVVVQPPLVEASLHPNPPQMTNGTNGMNGFHKEEVEEAVVEEETAPTSTFISEMIDIDDLLMKGSHFVALDSSPVFFNEEEDSTPKTHSGDFSNAKPIADIVQVGAVTTCQGGFLFIPHLAVGSPVYTIYLRPIYASAPHTTQHSLSIVLPKGIIIVNSVSIFSISILYFFNLEYSSSVYYHLLKICFSGRRVALVVRCCKGDFSIHTIYLFKFWFS